MAEASSGGGGGGAGAGGYATAILGVMDFMSGASADAAYEAAYGTYYRAATNMLNAANSKVAAEANIAAITQDKINTDTVIEMNQDRAEAMAKLSAAVNGTSGGSVAATIQQTEFNSSVAQSNNRKTAQQNIENQLAGIYQAQSTLLAVDNPQVQKSNLGLKLAQAGLGYIQSHGQQFMEGIDKLGTSNGDTGVMAMNYQLPTDNSTMVS